MIKDAIRDKWNDQRFTANHFSISDVNAKFLKRNGINKTVAEFKKEVKNSRYDFKAHTGNAYKVGHFQATKVYNINNFKRGVK